MRDSQHGILFLDWLYYSYCLHLPEGIGSKWVNYQASKIGREERKRKFWISV
jgi:hypothetical protein